MCMLVALVRVNNTTFIINKKIHEKNVTKSIMLKSFNLKKLYSLNTSIVLGNKNIINIEENIETIASPNKPEIPS